MMKALRGDKNALIVMAYEGMNPKHQIALLRKYDMSEEEFFEIKKEVMIHG